MAREKLQRQQAILEIIKEKPVSTQEELVEELRKRGFVASQATLSKDIRELGLLKVPTADGRFRYTDEFRTQIETPEKILRKRFRDSVTEIDNAAQIVVLKTLPGYAPSIAYEIDRASWEEVIGTIAGDDTVFIAVGSAKDANTLVKRCKEYIEYEGDEEY